MATTIEQLKIQLTVEERNLKQAQSNLKDLKDQIDKVNGTPLNINGVNKASGYMKELTMAMNPVQLGATAIGAAFVALAGNAINAADQIQDLADATGQSAGSLMNLKQSIIEAGGSSEDFTKIATKLAVSTGDAMRGNKEAQESFRDLGVFVTDSSGKLRDQDEIMQDVIKELGKIEDPAVRAAKAYDMLGKAAAKIDWSKVNAAKDAIKDADIQRIADMRGELDKLYNTIENSLIGAFGRLAKSINEAFPSNLDARIARLKKSLSDLESRGQGNSMAANLQKSQLADAEKELQARKDINAETNKLAKLSESRTAAPKTGGYGKSIDSSDGTKTAPVDKAAQYVESIRSQIQSVQELSTEEKLLADIQANRYGTLTEKQKASMIASAQELDTAKRLKKEWAEADKAFEDDAKKMAAGEAEAKRVGEMIEGERKVFEAKQLGLDQMLALEYAMGRQGELARKLAQIEIETATRVAEHQKALLLSKTEAERQAILARIAMEEEAGRRAIERETIKSANDETRDQSYTAGFQVKMAEMAKAMTPFQMAQNATQMAFQSIGSSIDQMVETGKASFSDLAKSIIKDIVKMIAKQMVFNALKSSMGPAGGLTSLLGFAKGGSVQGEKPYIVGEKGPELFIPGGNGTVIPNRNLQAEKPQQTTIQNINVSAIDGASVAKFFMQNKHLAYAATKSAQKEYR